MSLSNRKWPSVQDQQSTEVTLGVLGREGDACRGMSTPQTQPPSSPSVPEPPAAADRIPWGLDRLGQGGGLSVPTPQSTPSGVARASVLRTDTYRWWEKVARQLFFKNALRVVLTCSSWKALLRLSTYAMYSLYHHVTLKDIWRGVLTQSKRQCP